jgi:hypothetical protein
MSKTRIAYQCNAQGVYLGETTVQEDPMSPGVYLLPSNATFNAPPTIGSGQQAVFAGDAWTVENIPAPVTPESKPLTLAQAQALQIAVLTEACRASIESGFTSDALGSTHSYPSTVQDQTNQHTIASRSAGGGLKCEQGGAWMLVTHSQAQAQAVIDAFALWLNECQQQLVNGTTRVYLAETVADAQAVSWTGRPHPMSPPEETAAGKTA